MQEMRRVYYLGPDTRTEMDAVQRWLVPYKQDDDGEDYVVTDKGELIHCTFEFECLPTGMARIPHWATCPYANEFKRK